jgi:hypothetical protein
VAVLEEPIGGRHGLDPGPGAVPAAAASAASRTLAPCVRVRFAPDYNAFSRCQRPSPIPRLRPYVGRPIEDVLCVQEHRVVGAEQLRRLAPAQPPDSTAAPSQSLCPRHRAHAHRRWSDGAKGQVVADSYEPEVARRHDISPQHLFGWREAARAGRMVLPTATPTPTANPGTNINAATPLRSVNYHICEPIHQDGLHLPDQIERRKMGQSTAYTMDADCPLLWTQIERFTHDGGKRNQAALVVGNVGPMGIMRGRQLRRPLKALEMMCALLRYALDRESMKFRILVANLPGFLERR